MYSFRYCPNRTSRVIDIQIDARETQPGLWDADCAVYENVAGVRLFRGGGIAVRGVSAPTEDAFLDEVESLITGDIENGRGIAL